MTGSESKDAPLVEQIVSGGQTGVDRAALDVAIELGLPHGGWCPRGRLAEDGVIPPRYQLLEADSSDYQVRTEQNVIDSDATLILYRNELNGGTRLTFRMARKHDRPFLLVNLDAIPDIQLVREWLRSAGVKRLNVAGPRASSQPAITDQAAEFLRQLFRSGCV